MNEIVEKENIENLIYEIRGKQVMLDSDLARLYKCKSGTKEVNQAVKNNIEKFPERFSWILTDIEYYNLRSKFFTSSEKSNNHGGRRYKPRVFTEQGVAMLATILKTKVATEVSIAIMDAFVAMKHYIGNNEIENLLLTNRFQKAEYNKIICKDVIGANIDYLTVHKSKGTGYDQVILINAVNDKLGFPSQIVDSNLMKKLNINQTYTIDYPEERRLFYVALTRTKNKVYILAPKVPITKKSEFIREIEKDKNILRINS